MNEKLYKNIITKNSPKENCLSNTIMVFFVGGVFGALSELLLNIYCSILSIPRKEGGIIVIITLIVIASFLTGLGVFDVLVSKFKCALIIPITGFAHSICSAALDYKNEGLIYGIGSNIFKLAGNVILYGIVSVYVFGIIRLFIIGG